MAVSPPSRPWGPARRPLKHPQLPYEVHEGVETGEFDADRLDDARMLRGRLRHVTSRGAPCGGYPGLASEDPAARPHLDVGAGHRAATLVAVPGGRSPPRARYRLTVGVKTVNRHGLTGKRGPHLVDL